MNLTGLFRSGEYPVSSGRLVAGDKDLWSCITPAGWACMANCGELRKPSAWSGYMKASRCMQGSSGTSLIPRSLSTVILQKATTRRRDGIVSSGATGCTLREEWFVRGGAETPPQCVKLCRGYLPHLQDKPASQRSLTCPRASLDVNKSLMKAMRNFCRALKAITGGETNFGRFSAACSDVFSCRSVRGYL